MTEDQKRYLRTNERLATIVAAEVCRSAAGGQVTCFAFELDGGGILGDRFDFSYQGCSPSTPEHHRHASLCQAMFRREGDWIGQQVIIELDERGNPYKFRPPLARPSDSQ